LAICDAVEWKHLPVVGGLYDQHPDFLEAAMLLFEARSRHEEEKRRQEEKKSEGKGRGTMGRRGRR
jgi:hypothetical protein